MPGSLVQLRFVPLGAVVALLVACSSDAPTNPVDQPGGAGGAQAGASSAGQNGQDGGTSGSGATSGGANAGNSSAGTSNSVGTSGAASSGHGGAAGNPAGGSAGTSTGGTGTLCPAGAQLCLDFEDGDFKGWTKSGKTLSVDSMHASHGTQALHISVAVNDAGGMLVNQGAPLFPLPQKQMWGRMMVYFDGVPDGHTDMANAKGQGAANYNVGEQHASIMLNYYAGSSATDCWARPKPEKKVPDKTWMCWEWRFDSANNQMDFWMDGTLLRSVNGKGDGCGSGNGTWQAPAAFESISIGERVAERSSTTAYNAWIDDVAISNSARVGCPVAQ